jgi:hypothetical protein
MGFSTAAGFAEGTSCHCLPKFLRVFYRPYPTAFYSDAFQG